MVGSVPRSARPDADEARLAGSGRRYSLRRGGPAQPRQESALAALGVDHDVKVYPDAGHGFINDPAPADATPFLIFLAKISGTRYYDASAQDARRRIAAFFGQHLRA